MVCIDVKVRLRLRCVGGGRKERAAEDGHAEPLRAFKFSLGLHLVHRGRHGHWQLRLVTRLNSDLRIAALPLLCAIDQRLLNLLLEAPLVAALT